MLCATTAAGQRAYFSAECEVQSKCKARVFVAVPFLCQKAFHLSVQHWETLRASVILCLTPVTVSQHHPPFPASEVASWQATGVSSCNKQNKEMQLGTNGDSYRCQFHHTLLPAPCCNPVTLCPPDSPPGTARPAWSYRCEPKLKSLWRCLWDSWSERDL